jgi:transposase-like protein
MSVASHFKDEEAAYRFLEERVWPDGPVCPHCGGFERLSKMRGKSTRIGLYKCYECRRPFRVTVGTFFEFSHVPLHVWLRAIYLECSNPKGFQRTILV